MVATVVVAILTTASVCVGAVMTATGVHFVATDGVGFTVVAMVGVGVVLLVLPFFTLRDHARWLRRRRRAE